ncbi:hypothetical protein CN093_08765 [Sinorhizobium meliloti]|uniref:group I intron-associated PD-(D/E)XK endonuclease n=1 Tax=Rhizobium meliloti TaxID=382 RepID=UPI000FD4D74E|nr:group I intron-associated PD-(D/E)XK endonuclease [Sinorhizobium meliloti]RVO41345.1 hypothetical protein CN093_08765 [Sinorhizobium meliloti]
MEAANDNVSARALEIGKAGEHLVCADLILQGYRAFLSDQGLPYDVLIDHDGRLYRVQVKSSLKPKNANARGRSPNLVYVFYARRRGRDGFGERLTAEHCDIIACVGLDTRVVAYFPQNEVAQTLSLFPPGYEFKGKFKRSRYAPIDGFPIERALSLCA